MDSVVLFHCDDQELFKSLKVLQFLPQLEVGAELMFVDELYEDYIIDAEESYVKCMKTQTRNYRQLPGNQRNTSPKSSSCKVLLEENEKLKFQFQWVYFKDLTQYLIPFGAVIGTLMLASIIGTIWDCSHEKKISESAAQRGNRLNNVCV